MVSRRNKPGITSFPDQEFSAADEGGDESDFTASQNRHPSHGAVLGEQFRPHLTLIKGGRDG